jgi:hypothetical protein
VADAQASLPGCASKFFENKLTNKKMKAVRLKAGSMVLKGFGFGSYRKNITRRL